MRSRYLRGSHPSPSASLISAAIASADNSWRGFFNSAGD
jgi:hypothetical protein